MDSLLTAAARALASGDPLGALQRVALREDPDALALRGIAMAQLGELARARELLKRAKNSFGAHEALARARCTLAEAEIALAARELEASAQPLEAARRVLERRGDVANAAHAQLIEVRRLLLLGRVTDAARVLEARAFDDLPPMLDAFVELARADIALRTARGRLARSALDRALASARRAGIPMLASEAEHALRALASPAARLIESGQERLLLLEEVEDVLASDRVVIDACRRSVRRGTRVITLAKRPVLFALARALGAAFPSDVARDVLIERAFGTRKPNASHRARLRVEIGRLRRELRALAELNATPAGFALRAASPVVVLAPPIDEIDTTLLALLADGAAWTTSSLALAHGSSQRSVQRALSELEAQGRVRSLGRGRSRRWLAVSLAECTTSLLLPATLAAD